MSSADEPSSAGTQPAAPNPYLVAALLCERVLQEKDGVKSAIRIIDQVILGDLPEGLPQAMIVQPLSMLITLKRGLAATEEVHLAVTTVDPTGRTLTAFEVDARFPPGGDAGAGVDVIGEILVDLSRAGLYWFEVRLNRTLVTRSPLRVIDRRTAKPAAVSETGG